MSNWLSENGLALYGAIAGTVALAINFFGFRHNLKKDRIKLSVSFADHPRQADNLLDLESTEDGKPWDQKSLAEVYVVTVRNVGNVAAPIDEVGVVTSSGKKRPALVGSKHHGPNILERASGGSVDPLPPNSSRKFNMYLNRGEQLYGAAQAYVVDQAGKTWSSDA